MTNAWTLTGVKAGSVDGLAFSSMDHLVGGTGDDTLTGANTVNSWKLTGPNAGTLGTMTFAGMEHLVGGTGVDTLTGLNSTNAWTLTGPNAGTLGALTFAAMEGLIGGTGTDTLTGPNIANTWLLSGLNAGKIGTLAFKSMENVVGGTNVDTFEFTGTGSVVSLNGGGAPVGTADWLDYSRLPATVPVTVNLASHVATGVTDAISNMENVRGGKGTNKLTGDSTGNILIGGLGNDVIVGGTGKSLLIGDKGLDSITGHSANDILIGDYTAYDASTAANNTALMAILSEWKSADSYANRFAEIKGGTISGYAGVKLNYGTTVKNDSAADRVTGSASATAHDWYFASTGDTTTNLHTGEYLNNAIH
jgi:Ca2+-binding RTX toxin-like protein